MIESLLLTYIVGIETSGIIVQVPKNYFIVCEIVYVFHWNVSIQRDDVSYFCSQDRTAVHNSRRGIVYPGIGASFAFPKIKAYFPVSGSLT